MTRAAVIIDTNVVVAGLLTPSETSPVARILNGMIAASFPYVLSEALLAEYDAVLTRAPLRRRHGLTVAEIENLLTELAQHATVLQPVEGPPAPDPGDQLLWNLLATRPELRLVTGDRLLRSDSLMQGRVMTPSEFVEGERDAFA